MKVSFEGVNEQVLSFKSASLTDGALEGKFIKMSDNFTVAACAATNAFAGMCIHDEGGFADVMTHGYVECTYTGETAPAVGYAILNCASATTVQAAETGREVLVLKVDTTNKIVGFIM